MATANRNIDIEDLIPAQVAGVMFLIQFGIVELVAYDGAFDLDQTYAIAGFDVSLAFFVSAGALGIIMLTNELGAPDLMFWDDGDDDELDEIYGGAILGTVGLLVAVEFVPQVNDFILSSDVAGTAAFLTSVVAVWAIVWIR